jgi:hypothetical protein
VSTLSDPAQYRQSAAECLRAMHATSNERSKAVLLLMAEAWAKLADQAEQLVERSPPIALASAMPPEADERPFQDIDLIEWR